VAGRYYGEAGQVIETAVVQPEPAYVFLALARCGAWLLDGSGDNACTGVRASGALLPNGVFLYFDLEMRNPGGYWRAHFSADEQGLFEFHIVLLALCALLGLGCVLGARARPIRPSPAERVRR
jgi:hypothetical protein